jgi:hypothetical protein
MTGEGGQQFNYDMLTPNRFAPFADFYTSNVSVKRALLIKQEEMFSNLFPYAAFEDTELALRMARKGFRLWYHARARAGHWHPMTDRQALDRQYRVGRMLLTYSLLHPERVREEHKGFLHWLDVAQHDLLRQADFARACADLAPYSRSLESWLNQFSLATHSLSTHIDPERVRSLPGQLLVEKERKQWAKHNQMLYAYQFDLMLYSGMADEWMGVGPDEKNPVRDLVRLKLSTGVWKLLSRGTPDAPVPNLASSRAERMLRVARKIRHHPWLAHTFTRLTRLPGYRPFKVVAKRMLHLLS